MFLWNEWGRWNSSGVSWTRAEKGSGQGASNIPEMRYAIIDSDVYIGHWERGDFERVLSDLRRSFIVRHSAVVLSELRRGARTTEARTLIAALHRIALPLWEPTAADWWETGGLVRDIGDAEHWETSKRRDFQNDALIALTARRYGAAVVTHNQRDFSHLSRRLGIRVITASD